VIKPKVRMMTSPVDPQRNLLLSNSNQSSTDEQMVSQSSDPVQSVAREHFSRAQSFGSYDAVGEGQAQEGFMNKKITRPRISPPPIPSNLDGSDSAEEESLSNSHGVSQPVFSMERSASSIASRPPMRRHFSMSEVTLSHALSLGDPALADGSNPRAVSVMEAGSVRHKRPQLPEMTPRSETRSKKNRRSTSKSSSRVRRTRTKSLDDVSRPNTPSSSFSSSSSSSSFRMRSYSETKDLKGYSVLRGHRFEKTPIPTEPRAITKITFETGQDVDGFASRMDSTMTLIPRGIESIDRSALKRASFRVVDQWLKAMQENREQIARELYVHMQRELPLKEKQPSVSKTAAKEEGKGKDYKKTAKSDGKSRSRSSSFLRKRRNSVPPDNVVRSKGKADPSPFIPLGNNESLFLHSLIEVLEERSLEIPNIYSKHPSTQLFDSIFKELEESQIIEDKLSLLQDLISNEDLLQRVSEQDITIVLASLVKRYCKKMNIIPYSISSELAVFEEMSQDTKTPVKVMKKIYSQLDPNRQVLLCHILNHLAKVSGYFEKDGVSCTAMALAWSRDLFEQPAHFETNANANANARCSIAVLIKFCVVHTQERPDWLSSSSSN